MSRGQCRWFHTQTTSPRALPPLASTTIQEWDPPTPATAAAGAAAGPWPPTRMPAGAAAGAAGAAAGAGARGAPPPIGPTPRDCLMALASTFPKVMWWAKRPGFIGAKEYTSWAGMWAGITPWEPKKMKSEKSTLRWSICSSYRSKSGVRITQLVPVVGASNNLVW